MNYNPPRVLTQGRASATVMTSTALRKRLMDGRASLSLSVTDPLDLYRPSTTTFDRGFRESGRERVSTYSGGMKRRLDLADAQPLQQCIEPDHESYPWRKGLPASLRNGRQESVINFTSDRMPRIRLSPVSRALPVVVRSGLSGP